MMGSFSEHAGIYIFVIIVVVIFIGFAAYFFLRIWPERFEDSMFGRHIKKPDNDSDESITNKSKS